MDPLTEAKDLAAAFARDGVVCVRAALHAARWPSRPGASTRCSPTRARWPWWPAEPMTRARSPRTSAAGRRSRDRAAGPAFAGPADRRHADGHAAGPPLPRSRPGEGGRDQAAHALAPGPAVLQRRRPRRERLDPGGPGARGRVPGAGGHVTPRPVADAAHVPARGGALVPRGKPGRTADIEADRGAFDIRRFDSGAGRRPSSSTSCPCTGHPGSPTRRAGGGCCRCGTSRPAPGTPRGSGVPRPRSLASTGKLAAGVPMEHPLFPEVWPA